MQHLIKPWGKKLKFQYFTAQLQDTSNYYPRDELDIV